MRVASRPSPGRLGETRNRRSEQGQRQLSFMDSRNSCRQAVSGWPADGLCVPHREADGRALADKRAPLTEAIEREADSEKPHSVWALARSRCPGPRGGIGLEASALSARAGAFPRRAYSDLCAARAPSSPSLGSGFSFTLSPVMSGRRSGAGLCRVLRRVPGGRWPTVWEYSSGLTGRYRASVRAQSPQRRFR